MLGQLLQASANRCSMVRGSQAAFFPLAIHLDKPRCAVGSYALKTATGQE